METKDWVDLMSEAALLEAVADLLEAYGWMWCHFRPARTKDGWRTPLHGHKGLPDIIAARRGRILFAELKSQKGKLEPEQEDWQSAILSPWLYVTHEYYIFRPSDWRAGTIEGLLRG